MPFSGPSNVQSFAAFSAVGDGVTDNSLSWMNFGTWARSQSSAGIGVELIIPPGVYLHSIDQCFGALWGINNLKISGYGASVQNVSNSLSQPFFTTCQPLRDASNSYKSYLIQQTTPGTSSFTLASSSDASNLTVGQFVMLASLDIQYNGFPINCDQFEYVKITAINSTSGVVSIDRNIKYTHRTDYPDAPAGNPLCGAARVWLLNTSGWLTRGSAYPIDSPSWDVDHTYEGLTILQPKNFPSTIYYTLTGRKIRTENCKGLGVSESVAQRVEHAGDLYLYPSEPDKLVEQIVYDGIESRTFGVPFNFQSSSIDSVSFRSCKFIGGLNSGAVKSVLIENCDIDSLGTSGGLGLNRSVDIINSRVFAYPYPSAIGGFLAYDGSNVTFSNGIIRILISSGVFINAAAVVPGSQVYLSVSAGVPSFPGDVGMGYITKIYNDSTYYYISTTLPYASLPSWSNGFLGVTKQGSLSIRNCKGCENAENSSYADLVGLREWNVQRLLWAGNQWPVSQKGVNSGYTQAIGSLTKISVDVIQTCAAVSPSVLQIQQSVYNSLTMALLGTINFNVDLTVSGTRSVGQSSSSLLGSDTLQLGSSTISSLPSNSIVGGVFLWRFANYNQGQYADNLLPVVELVANFDAGQFRKLMNIGGLA